MTIIRGEQLKHGHREKDFGKFYGNFDLNETAEEFEQQPDLQWELLQNHHSGCNELSGKMEKNDDSASGEAQHHGEQVPQTRTFEGRADHLLVLAQSSEVVVQSEDRVAQTHSNNQNEHNNMVDQISQEHASIVTVDDQERSRKVHEGSSAFSHVSGQRFGFCHEVSRMRLTQIQKHARCKHLIMNQETTEDNQCKHSRGKTMRLSHIKHQARCKSKNDLSPQVIIGHRNELAQGRILRLSKMKHQARSKDNSTVKEGTEEHMDMSQYCNRLKDSNVSAFEGVPANRFFRGASQSSAVRWDDENIREHQRVARRLRAFKTKKLRQQLKTECIRSSTDTGPTELSKEIQGQLGYNHSLGLRYESLQHIPNGLPVQNNLKEYHRVVARQQRAERLEKKRALKYKKQNSKNHALVNSEAPKESTPVKRLRLTQLRREVRLGNQTSIMQRPAEN